jgi:hypothetical protein
LNVFKTASLHHVRAVQQLLARYQGEASIDLATYAAEVRARNRYYKLYPQFVCSSEGRTRYSIRPEADMTGFVGWLPYFNKRWPIGTGKFPFKEYCQQNGLSTPRMWRKPGEELREFVVKIDSGSFGQGLRGPFRHYDPAHPAHALGDGGYFEAFVRGRILKVFYWEDRLVCVEMLDMPSVEGDGSSTVRELVARRLGPRTPESEWKVIEEIVAYGDLKLDAVPAAGRKVMFDFRYGSSGHPVTYHNTNALLRMQDSPITRQLVECGRVLWQGIPEATRMATLFSVDAIADAEDRVWLLEMNCNPVCHPDVYPYMFEPLFGPVGTAERVEAPAPPPQAALPRLTLTGGGMQVLPQSIGAAPRPWRAS